MEKSRSAQKIKLSSYEDIFKPEHTTAPPDRLPLSALHPFKDHPFKQYSEEKKTEMVESVKLYGILMPILVRPLGEGEGYEIVSGHNRVIAAREAGLTDIPATVREMDDDTATIIMIDSNLRQRERLLPSEKAFAYKMKLDAIRRQGERTDLTSVQVELKLQKTQARDIIAEQAGESGPQITRYIRLTNLIPLILNIVDDNRMAFNPAVAVSYLELDQQAKLLSIMERDGSSPSLVQAEKLKELSQKGELNDAVMESIMGELKPQQTQVVLKGSEVTKYFPPGTSVEKISQTILKLLDIWYKKQQEKQQSQEDQPPPPTRNSYDMER